MGCVEGVAALKYNLLGWCWLAFDGVVVCAQGREATNEHAWVLCGVVVGMEDMDGAEVVWTSVSCQ